ncbi:MAG: hypothetical protein FJ179_03945 [Gammaproteobacteria bacterium]|nr:hypothetical protein [Gammaproteobacteria bacterium]
MRHRRARMDAPDTLLLKIVMVPALVAAVTLLGRRYGQGVGGWLGSFPIVAGPVLFVLAYENGVEFGARAAEAALLAIAPAMLFYVLYGRLALRHGWPQAASLSVLAWLLVMVALGALNVPLVISVLLVLVALGGSGWALTKLVAKATPTAAATQISHRFELPARMLTGAVVTLVTSELGKLGGAAIGGYASLFPSIGLVVAAFNHAQSGPTAAVRFLHGMTRGMWSVGSFCLALAFALPAFGLALGFGAAVLVALATHALSRPRELSQSL